MRCKGETITGKQCKRDAVEDKEYCWQHQPGVESKAGRPVKYDKEFIETLADKMIEWFNSDEANLFLEKFMLSQGLHREYLTRFKNKNEYFCNALKRAKGIQKLRLIEGGLSGEFDRVMAIFTLKNVSDMRDKQTTEITGDMSINLEWENE